MKVSSHSTNHIASSSNMWLSEDELHNIDMAEDEKDEKRHELKTKRRDYTGYDDDEFVPGAEGMKRAVLSKYDEDIDGPKQGVSLLFYFHRCTSAKVVYSKRSGLEWPLRRLGQR